MSSQLLPGPSSFAMEATSSDQESQLTLSLPEDLLCKVTSFLDVRSLATMGVCNRQFHDLTLRNEAGWKCLCQKLWISKVFAPDLDATTKIEGISFKKAYRESIEDAKARHHLTIDELCYDPETQTGIIWCFRFKEAAGKEWTAIDPWHQGLPSRKLVFLRDGSIQEYTAALDQPGPRPNARVPPGGTTNNPPLTMSWRFLTKPIDWPRKVNGSYVRIAVTGREVPTYSVRRSPTENWGFIMESCWGLFASFELPLLPKRDAEASHQGQPGEEPRMRLRRTDTGARWVEVHEDGEETLESCPYHNTRRRSRDSARHPDEMLTDDSDLIITNEIQWREAFLYNVGARVLPEGDNAAADFDRTFRGN